MPDRPEPTAVYRHYDDEGSLLYIGVSKASAILKQEGWLRFEAGHGLFAQQRPKLPHDWFYKLGFPG